jgi:aryl-alcohol dehydrogenase-like predicted oxidoreductase
MWTRDIEEDIVPTCRELGIKIVAYSPLGRGFLTGSLRSREDPSLDKQDFRLFGMPRFAEGNFEGNLALVDAVAAIAKRKGCSVGQLALAWVHSQGTDVIPIPGTTSIAHLDDNLGARNITLSPEEKAEIDEIFRPEKVVGDRYAHMAMTYHGNKDTTTASHSH